MVMAISDFFVTWWWLMAVIIGGAIVAFFALLRRSTAFRFAVDRVSLKIPVIGNILEKATIARWTRTLATMFAAGVPLVESLDAVAGASGNSVYAAATKRIQTEVSTGASLTNSMSNTKLFPSMVLQMTQIGEESGSLDSMLDEDRRVLRARGRRRRGGAVEPARADHHRLPRRRHRRPRRRDVPADLQARLRRLTAPPGLRMGPGTLPRPRPEPRAGRVAVARAARAFRCRHDRTRLLHARRAVRRAFASAAF